MLQGQIFFQRRHELACPQAKAMIGGTMIFRDKLKILMERDEQDTGDVAKMLNVSYSNVYRWLSEKPEDANRYPTAPQMLGLARHFRVTMESLTDDTSEIVQATLPSDEAAVLEVFRRIKARHGLDHLDVIQNMGNAAFQGKKAPHPEDAGPGSSN